MSSEDRRSSDSRVPSWLVAVLIALIVLAAVVYLAHDRTPLHWANREWFRAVLGWFL